SLFQHAQPRPKSQRRFFHHLRRWNGCRIRANRLRRFRSHSPMRHLPTAAFGALGAFWLLDCSANRVPSRVLERLPYESEVELLEAENDRALAVDHLEEARNEVTRHRGAIRRAKDRLSAA